MPYPTYPRKKQEPPKPKKPVGRLPGFVERMKDLRPQLRTASTADEALALATEVELSLPPEASRERGELWRAVARYAPSLNDSLARKVAPYVNPVAMLGWKEYPRERLEEVLVAMVELQVTMTGNDRLVEGLAEMARRGELSMRSRAGQLLLERVKQNRTASSGVLTVYSQAPIFLAMEDAPVEVLAAIAGYRKEYRRQACLHPRATAQVWRAALREYSWDSTLMHDLAEVPGVLQDAVIRPLLTSYARYASQPLLLKILPALTPAEFAGALATLRENQSAAHLVAVLDKASREQMAGLSREETQALLSSPDERLRVATIRALGRCASQAPLPGR